MDDKIKERCKTCEKQCMQENLDRLRGVEILSSRSQPQSIDQLSRSYQEVRSFLDRSTQLSKGVEIVIKNSLRAQQISQVLRRCRDCLKTVFQKGKNTDMNAIKHATQIKIMVFVCVNMTNNIILLLPLYLFIYLFIYFHWGRY